MHLALPVHFAIGILTVALTRFYIHRILNAYSPRQHVYETCATCGDLGHQTKGHGTRRNGRTGCPACNYQGFIPRYEHR